MKNDSILNRLNIVDIVELIQDETNKNIATIDGLEFYYKLWIDGRYNDMKMKQMLIDFYKELFTKINKDVNTGRLTNEQMRAFENHLESTNGK